MNYDIPKVKRKKWPRKVLGELANFLEQFYPNGLSLTGVAKDLGTTPQAISNMFRRDDMKLSKAEEIANIYGYQLKLYYPVRIFNDGYTPPSPVKLYPNAGNLTGLVKYIQDSEWSVTFVAEQNGLSTSTLTTAFTRGDIQLSTLYQVLDCLGMWVSWKFLEKDETKHKQKAN